MTILDAAPILENGAVLTKAGAIVDLELEGETGLFFMSNVDYRADRKRFDSRTERDEALLKTVRLYLDQGWTLVGEGRDD